MKNKYSTTKLHEGCAKALGRDLGISTKQAIVIADFLRGKEVEFAIDYLKSVIELKKAIPFPRFTNGVGHKAGMAAGRYPVKASEEILKVLKSAYANAQDKGLSTESMVVNHICAHRASQPMRMGRQKRRQMKRSHVEIVLEEVEIAPKKEKTVAKKTVVKKTAAKDTEKEVKASAKKETKAVKKATKKTTTKKAAKKVADKN